MDDEKDILEFYKELFSETLFEVVGSALDGLSAIETFKKMKIKPDIVIMDYKMPKMDGLEATKELFKIDSRIKIIFVTADLEIKLKALDLGAEGFLEKPFERKALMNILDRVLEPLKIPEEMLIEDVEYPLEKGKIYLLVDQKFKNVLDFFSKLLSKKKLVITRRAPNFVKSQLKEAPVIWLTQIEGIEDSIDPSNLSKLVNTLASFIGNNQNSVILLDGFEYIMTHNGFLRTLRYLNLLNDVVMTSKARIFILIASQSFEERELSILKRETKVLRKLKA